MTNWLNPNPFVTNPTWYITKEQVREAKKKISQWNREHFGFKISPARITTAEVVSLLETIVSLKQQKRLDPKMRLLMQSLESEPHAIEIS